MPGGAKGLGALQKVQLSIRAAAQLGGSTTAAIFANSLRASRQRARERRAGLGPTTTRTPGPLLEVVALGGPDPEEGSVSPQDPPVLQGARCRFAEALLEVAFLAPDVVRISWGPEPEPVPRGFPDHSSLGGCEVTLEAGPGVQGCRLTSSALEVEVSPEGAVVFSDRQGRLLRAEHPPRRRGAQRFVTNTLRHGEAVAGLGERAGGVDLRGGRYLLWNADPGGSWGTGTDPLYCSIPVTVGLHPDGDVLVFYDNSYRGVVTMDAHRSSPTGAGRVEVAFAGGMVRHYVVAGPLPHLLERYGALTGLAPLPPRWALGYHQCRWGYRSEQDVNEVAEGFGAEGLPLSAIHLDIDYMEGYRVFTVDPEAFPDLPRLARGLAQRGTRLVTIVDPGIKVDEHYEVYADGLTGGRFVHREDGTPVPGVVWPGPSVFPDFTDPEVRTWWSSWYTRLIDAGVSGLWHDMNEPTSIMLFGDPTLPSTAHHHLEGRGGLHVEAHNLYGLLMNRAGWSGAFRARPDRRPFVVSRAGWAGVQRWAWVWTGDAESSWEGLRQQVATVVGLGLSGVPFVGPDIGGFSGVPSPELYTRWLELSLFLPYCRTHSVVGAPPREPWRFPEPHRARIGDLIRARYRLLPYLYTLAWEASRTGHPLARPLCWPEDERRGADPGGSDRRLLADDQFLVGQALVVAPVTAPGATERLVRLPQGSWFRFHLGGGDHGGEGPDAGPVDGGRVVRTLAPLGHPAVFVRAGSIVPLDDAWSDQHPPRQATARHEPQRLALHCWPGPQGRAAGVVYDDAGDGDGDGRLDSLELGPDPAAQGHGQMLVLVRRSEGQYPPPDSLQVVLHGLWVTHAQAAGVSVPVDHPAPGLSVLECPGSFSEVRLSCR